MREIWEAMGVRKLLQEQCGTGKNGTTQAKNHARSESGLTKAKEGDKRG